jgi:hypothetical protein
MRGSYLYDMPKVTFAISKFMSVVSVTYLVDPEVKGHLTNMFVKGGVAVFNKQ